MRPYTVFARESLRAGRPARFVTVLLPHGPQQPAAELAKGISLEDGEGPTAGPAGAIAIRLEASGKPVEIGVGPEGTLSVLRR